MTAATTTRKPTTRTRKPAARTRRTAGITPAQARKAKLRTRYTSAVRLFVIAYLLTALGMSFTHIADLFGIMGSDWQRWIAPVVIDSVAVIGKLSMADAFQPKTRRRGLVALWVAGTVSFTANVTVGYVEHMYGNAVLGAAVVLGALWAESHLSSMKQSTAK